MSAEALSAKSARAGVSVGNVSRDDAGTVAQMLARAFFDDPLTSYFIPDETGRDRKLARMFRLLLRLAAPFNSCHVTSGNEAAAIWRPPGEWHLPFWVYVTNAPDLLAIFGAGALRVMSSMDIIEKRHPSKPHWYLQTIGTEPAKQGKGFGGIVLRHQLARADATGAACYLESSKPSNVPIYKNFGFDVTGEIKLPDGPTLWPMWRNPRGA